MNDLGGVPILISGSDMSNTIPDEKITTTFIGYLAARLLDLSRSVLHKSTYLSIYVNFSHHREIKAARVIQLSWRRFIAIRREEELKVKYK